MNGRRSGLAWGLALLSGSLAVGALAVGIGDGTGWHEILASTLGIQVLMALTFPVLGALLVARAAGNRLAWVFVAVGLSRGLALLARYWALHDYRAAGGWPFPDEMAFVALAMLFVAPVLAPLSLLWFPDGRLPDGRARWRLGLGLVAVSAAALLVLLSQAWLLRGPSLVDDSPAPAGVVSVSLSILLASTVAGVLVGVLAVVARLRGQDRVVRQQVKWYLFGAVAAFVLNVAGDLVPSGGSLNLVGTVAYEAAILVAVRRHALWDIDRVLNRTVVYGLLTVTVGTVYAGTVLGLGLLLGEVTLGRSAAVAAGTLATAVIAGPARRELQARVDRRFDRRTYDAVLRVARYGDPASLAPAGELERLLAEVLSDPELRLLFRCRGGDLVDAWGRVVDEPTAPTTSVTSADEEVAVLVHRAVPPYEQVLFSAVLRVASGAVTLARLQAELLVQVAVVEQSRRRIVEAADAERRRVERDLHDGAQQRLVALALTLRSEQRRHAGRLGPQAEGIIDLGVSEIRGSVDDLRALAAGLMPGSLVSEGLVPALRELVDRQPDAVRGGSPLTHRHSTQIEATAWFVAAEGLANSLKHAPGARVTLAATCDGSRLQIVVHDRGPGGAVDGPGLTGLQDRVLACSGTLDIDSPSGAGTRLIAMLPCV